MAEHSTLQHSSVHEPKWITPSTTADSGKVITPSATTSGTSELRKLTESDISYTDKSKNLFGWNDISDSSYTSGAPRAIAAAARTLLTNNAAAAQTDTSRLGAIWNVAGSYFQADDLNATYLARLNFKCTAVAAAGTPYIVLIETETSNGPTVIAGDTHMIKGGGAINQISESVLFYSGSFINNTQLKIYLTPDTNINIYDIGFVVQRLYREK